MKKHQHCLVVTFIFFVILSNITYATESYSVTPDAINNTERIYKDINPYFFVHYINGYIFNKFKLLNRYDISARTEMISKMYFYLSTAQPVKLVIKNDNNENLIIKLHILDTNDDRVLGLIAENNGEINSIMFEVKNGKLIRSFNKYSLEQENKRKSNLNNLANYYLFDDFDENDKLIEGYLKEYINIAKSPKDKLGGSLTLVQYYLSIKNFPSAILILKNALQILNNEIKNQSEILEMQPLYSVIDDEYNITLKIVEKSNTF